MSDAIKRDEKGRLIPGHGLKSPGRPPREIERAYLDAVVGLCNITTWGRIVEKAIEDALAGDRFARDWLTKHLIPDAAQALSDSEELAAPVRALTDGLTDEQLDRYIEKLRAARSA